MMNHYQWLMSTTIGKKFCEIDGLRETTDPSPHAKSDEQPVEKGIR